MFRQDLRYALRTLFRSPAITLLVITSPAIGIGANTAMFSVVNALLLKPLPYPDPDRLLGATPLYGRLLAMVLRQGLALTGIGMAAGLAGATALTRVMASLLFGISATDAVTFSAVPLILAAVACLARPLPAQRATRVDPVVALRNE
jgi:hypothetical protein